MSEFNPVLSQHCRSDYMRIIVAVENSESNEDSAKKLGVNTDSLNIPVNAHGMFAQSDDHIIDVTPCCPTCISILYAHF